MTHVADISDCSAMGTSQLLAKGVVWAASVGVGTRLADFCSHFRIHRGKAFWPLYLGGLNDARPTFWGMPTCTHSRELATLFIGEFKIPSVEVMAAALVSKLDRVGPFNIASILRSEFCGDDFKNKNFTTRIPFMASFLEIASASNLFKTRNMIDCEVFHGAIL